MSPTTTSALTITGAGLLGVGVAVAVGLLLVVPAMRNTCTLFTKRCANITYRIQPNGTLLLKDPATSLTYWFDGNFIRTYGPMLPGTCPSSVPVGATGVNEAIGEPRVLCDRIDPDGQCVSKDASAMPPTALTGASVERRMEPAFVMNGSTLRASEQQVLCSRTRRSVDQEFAAVPLKTLRVRLPEGSAPNLNITQIFEALKRDKVYVPPVVNPEPPVCNGHGEVDPLTTLCVCDSEHTGERCATRLCYKYGMCGNGTCNGGLCECDEGWTGDTCTARKCATPCVNGQCDGETGTCVCTPGFTGDGCRNYICMPTCGLHGRCNGANGVCECEENWTGTTCENVACPNNCSGHGVCNAPNGVCECVEGWVGVACETPACTAGCSGRGDCDRSTNTCTCDRGWSGADCSTPRCVRGCCSHGTCTIEDDEWTCVCNPGWSGDDCGTPDDQLTGAAWCPGTK